MTTLPTTNISLSNLLTVTGIRTAPPYSMSNTSLIMNLNINQNSRPFALGFFRGKSITNAVPANIAAALSNEIFYLPFGTGALPTTDTYGAAISASPTNPTMISTNARGSVLNIPGNSFLFTTNNFALTTSYTKMAWIYPLSNHIPTGNIISSYTGVEHYIWFQNSTNLSAGHGIVNPYVTDPQPIASNVWTHYAVTYDNTTQTMALYRNGFVVNSTTNAALAWSGSTGQLGIGTYQGGNIFNGYIDDVRVFSRALTAEHINTIFVSVNPLLLINRITSATPVAAYSLKLINANYSNHVVQVRRFGDNVVQNFHSTANGILSTGVGGTGTTYSNWVGASGIGYVVTWYDQTGRGKHVTQPSSSFQPTLVNDGLFGFCIYSTSTRSLAGPNVFDVTTTSNMHLVMTSKEISRVNNVLISLHGTNTDTPRFHMHGPYTDGKWYWDPLDFGNNRAVSTGTTAVGERVVFSGYKDPVTIKNGFRLNGGQSNVSTTNTAATVTGGIVFNVTTVGYSNNHYIYDAYVFDRRLSANDEIYMESNCTIQLPVLNKLTNATPVAAYSFTLVNGNYSNPVVRLRRSSDNSVQDFYSTMNGVLSTDSNGAGTPYATWVGGNVNNAFVETWYDQTGRGRHVTQVDTSKQPQLIYDEGLEYCVYAASNKSLSGTNVFDVTSTNNMHIVFASREITRVESGLISLNGNNYDTARFSIHAPWHTGNSNSEWYFDAGNYDNTNRAKSISNITSVNQRAVFSGFKDPAGSNGFRLNGGTRYHSTGNTTASVSGGIIFNMISGGWHSDHYIYGTYIFNSRLSASNESLMESYCAQPTKQILLPDTEYSMLSYHRFLRNVPTLYIMNATYFNAITQKQANEPLAFDNLSATTTHITSIGNTWVVLRQPTDRLATDTPTSTHEGVEYMIQINSTGNYNIQILTYAPVDTNDSFFYQLNTGAVTLFSPALSTTPQWNTVLTTSLTAGTQTFRIFRREAIGLCGIRVMQILIPFRIQNNVGTTWKYDSATNSIRLNTGADILFTCAENVNVYNYNENPSRSRFAIKQSDNNQYIYQYSGKYGLSNLDASSSNFAFRFISFDNGASYRIFNDIFTSWSGDAYNFTASGTSSTSNYSNYPYTQTWLAYNASLDQIVPVNWRDTSLSTSWYFNNASDVQSSTINIVNPVSHYSVSYPVRMFTADTETFSQTLYGSGLHTIARSQEVSTRQARLVFNGSVGDLNNVWQPSGSATGVGDWMQITFPFDVKIQSYTIDCGTGTVAGRCPRGWTISGYTFGSATKVDLHVGSRSTETGRLTYNLSAPHNNTFYRTIRFTIDVVVGTISNVPELRYFCTTV
jgi:hypothetical protein